MLQVSTALKRIIGGNGHVIAADDPQFW